MQHLKVLINKGQKEVKSYCFIKFHADTTDIGMEIKKKVCHTRYPGFWKLAWLSVAEGCGGPQKQKAAHQ